MSSSVIVRSSAKINLTLEIRARRDDGYHELCSIVQTVGLWDQLKLSRTDGPLALRCNRAGLEHEGNLCLRAARALRDRLQLQLGAAMELTKTIPTGAGLGGGSGNAAAALVGLCHLWELEPEREVLLALAGTVGADVPLFLTGGLLRMEGIGHRITSLGSGPNWYAVIIKPAVSISTRRAYRMVDRRGHRAAHHHDAVLAAIGANDLDAAAGFLCNDFEDAVLAEYSAVRDARSALLQTGAAVARMSGSGSAVFGLFADENAAAAAARKVPKFGETFIAPFVNESILLEST